MQLCTRTGAARRSVAAHGREVVRRSGWRGLFAGLEPALVRQFIQTGCNYLSGGTPSGGSVLLKGIVVVMSVRASVCHPPRKLSSPRNCPQPFVPANLSSWEPVTTLELADLPPINFLRIFNFFY